MSIKTLMVALAMGLGTAAVAAPMAADYIAKAGAGDLYEIKSSELVAKSTQNAGIRSFAKEMVTDHSKSTAEIKAAAKTSGLMPKPPTLDAMKQSNLDALMKASGTARDNLYLTQQRAAHDEALALHKDYAASGDKPALKAAAAKIVPVVEHHKMMLADLSAK